MCFEAFVNKPDWGFRNHAVEEVPELMRVTDQAINMKDKTFLRGHQVTDEQGKVEDGHLLAEHPRRTVHTPQLVDRPLPGSVRITLLASGAAGRLCQHADRMCVVGARLPAGMVEPGHRAPLGSYGSERRHSPGDDPVPIYLTGAYLPPV